MLEGGCACGAVRYRIGHPIETVICHCRLCQRSAGAPSVAFTTIIRADWIVLDGADRLREWHSTPFGRRRHCGCCGSLLTVAVDFQPDTIDVTTATLDDPSAVMPIVHIFCEEAPSWSLAHDGLPRHPRYRPDTPGLEPGRTSVD